jgi:hypothetical protein
MSLSRMGEQDIFALLGSARVFNERPDSGVGTPDSRLERYTLAGVRGPIGARPPDHVVGSPHEWELEITRDRPDFGDPCALMS